MWLSLFGTPARISTDDMISIILLPDEGKFGHNKKKFEDAEAHFNRSDSAFGRPGNFFLGQ